MMTVDAEKLHVVRGVLASLVKRPHMVHIASGMVRQNTLARVATKQHAFHVDALGPSSGERVGLFRLEKLAESATFEAFLTHEFHLVQDGRSGEDGIARGMASIARDWSGNLFDHSGANGASFHFLSRIQPSVINARKT